MLPQRLKDTLVKELTGEAVFLDGLMLEQVKNNLLCTHMIEEGDAYIRQKWADGLWFEYEGPDLMVTAVWVQVHHKVPELGDTGSYLSVGPRVYSRSLMFREGDYMKLFVGSVGRFSATSITEDEIVIAKEAALARLRAEHGKLL